MSVLIVFLYALVVVVSLLLIGLILIQPSKSGGMGAAFGGIGESVQPSPLRARCRTERCYPP